MKSDTKPSPAARIFGVTGVVLYLLTGVLYAVSGLLVPLSGLVVLWLIWVAGIYVLYRVWVSRRPWTPLVAVGMVILWWAYVTLGSYLFDWTA